MIDEMWDEIFIMNFLVYLSTDELDSALLPRHWWQLFNAMTTPGGIP